jgi:hypothetical protein
MKRRQFLSLVGGGVILAAAATTTSIALRQTKTALDAWGKASLDPKSDPRVNALSYAILAPNPHNRQPWLVDLSIKDQVILTVDTDRLLPHTDPYNRQITIGLGCFLEMMTLAAADQGYRVDLDLFPEGNNAEALDKRPVAHCRFIKDATVAADPLFAHVMDRRSVKEPYDLTRPVDPAALARVTSAVKHGSFNAGTAKMKEVEQLRSLTLQAFEIELRTPRTYKESVDLFRIGAKEIDRNPDGIDFSGPMFELMGATGFFTREAALDPEGTAFKEGVKAIAQNCNTAMAYLWQTTQTNDREHQILAGRDWLRIHLAATREGISLQPMSQVLQEYPEMDHLYGEFQQEFAVNHQNGETVQMFARLGYAEQVPPSPRWDLETRILQDG